MLTITVCGDSGIAHSVAWMCASRGHLVRVLVDDPTPWAEVITGELPDGSAIAGPLDLVTTNEADALRGSSLVFLCVDHAQIDRWIRRIGGALRPDQIVGAVPGFGGFGVRAVGGFAPGTMLFGLQRIPFVVGDHECGTAVRISGIRRQTFVGTIPAGGSVAVAELLEAILGVRTVAVSHYLNIELSPSNSIVNPARLYALFGPGATGPPPPEFFVDWNPASSAILLQLDDELQQARRLIPRDTSFVAPIRLQYDVPDADSLTARFRQLDTLRGRPVPVRASADGFALDTASPYVTEDVDHGLALVCEILALAGASTPTMDEILAWRRCQVDQPESADATRLVAAVRAFSDIAELAVAID